MAAMAAVVAVLVVKRPCVSKLWSQQDCGCKEMVDARADVTAINVLADVFKMNKIDYYANFLSLFFYHVDELLNQYILILYPSTVTCLFLNRK